MESILGTNDEIIVRQVKEWGEILVGFECRNRFEICDASGGVLGYAAEEGGGIGTVLARNFLGKCRACTLHIYGADQKEVAQARKPFRFYFHRMELFDKGKKIGAIQRRFSIFHRKFSLEDEGGNQVMTILSPWFRIWTFKLLVDDKEVGRVSKRWGGFLKEMFTDADTFGVQFSHPKLPVEVKKLLLAGVFLVDFTCFENNTRRSRIGLDG